MDEDLPGDKRVAAVTWVAITEDTVLDGTEADEPGAVMFRLMCSQPSAVARDFIDWTVMRQSRMESVVAALIDPSVADRLKEDYFDFVATCAYTIGDYPVKDTDIEIREVVEDVES